jgi:hypothetical protein
MTLLQTSVQKAEEVVFEMDLDFFPLGILLFLKSCSSVARYNCWYQATDSAKY